MASIDFTKQDKFLYAPPQSPVFVEVPTLSFIMVDGIGSPESNSYQEAIQILYALCYTIKMSKAGKAMATPKGYYEYKVPPLEGLWESDSDLFTPLASRDKWRWTSMIRQPDFVTEDVFFLAQKIASRKKPSLDFSRARFSSFSEGMAVQMMHIGPYRTEPVSIASIQEFILNNDLIDLCGVEGHLHHEIYLSDPRKCKPENLRTILRHPVKKKEKL